MSRKIAPRKVAQTRGRKVHNTAKAQEAALGCRYAETATQVGARAKAEQNLAGLLACVNCPGPRIIAEPLEAASKSDI